MIGGRIIAYSGAHGTGKTTSVYEFAGCLKKQMPNKRIGILEENAGLCPYPINKKMSRESQLWIFTHQIQAELAMTARYDLVVADRSAVDPIAYTWTADMIQLAEGMMTIIPEHLPIYQKIIFKTILNNQYLVDDGFRESDDFGFQLQVETIMLNLYSRLGFTDGDGIFNII